MKKIVLSIMLIALSSAAFASGFVHPKDFTGSEAQKQQVINYIEKRVKATYCDGQLNMCQPTTLRMMEQENLRAFKSLTSATNREVLDGVISTYCSSLLNMCDYTTLEMMYQENNNASNQKLSW